MFLGKLLCVLASPISSHFGIITKVQTAAICVSLPLWASQTFSSQQSHSLGRYHLLPEVSIFIDGSFFDVKLSPELGELNMTIPHWKASPYCYFIIVSVPVYFSQNNLSDLTLFIRAGTCLTKQYRTYKNTTCTKKLPFLLFRSNEYFESHSPAYGLWGKKST